MDSDEFRRRGKEMIDYVADYLDNIRDRRPLPEVKPGYIRKLMPDHAPYTGERWEDVFDDIERVIMPGVVHWQHPDFHAYFPSIHSYPATLANILSDSIGCFGFSWASSPFCTELEVVTMDWLAKLLNLPEIFLSTSAGNGGGVIQSSASEVTLMAMLSARARSIKRFKKENSDVEDGVILSKFIAYCSEEAHTSAKRAGMMSCIKIRSLETDDDASLRGKTLQDAIDSDTTQGLIPIFVCATLGSTSSCAFDNVKELGVVCDKEGMWMHIDAAYAGSSFICPEFRPLLNGIEYAESFNFNPSKWLHLNNDCSAMWIKDSTLLNDAYNVNAAYVTEENEGQMPDFRHWHIPFARRFRSLKLWFVLRLYGLNGLQEYIRRDVRLAKEFEDLVKKDSRFTVVGKVVLGLVCFRLKQNNRINEQLLKTINDDGRIHMVPSVVKGVFFLRFAICSPKTTSDDILHAWNVIQELADKHLKMLKQTQLMK